MAEPLPTPETFVFPKHHDFPPMWTIQPVLATRIQQYKRWSYTIQQYCRTLKIWRLNIPEQLSSPLFHHSILRTWLNLEEAKGIVEWMTGEEGGRRAEWLSETISSKSEPTARTTAWIYWKRPEEWANTIMDWIEATGQKGSVVTLYEIAQGEATTSQEFHGMDLELLQKTLQVLVKRGKAQVFGASEEQGVKFF